jgi:hypothetical protein
MNSADTMSELRQACPGASPVSEGGQQFIYLPALKISFGKEIAVRDALLTLQAHSGYPSRLFLTEPIHSQRTANWTTHMVLGRTWHTPSWGNVPPARPVEMLLQHLKAYA